jgi:S-adenosylmethionine decarboxylase
MNIKELHKQGNHLIFDGSAEADLNNLDFIKQFILDLVDVVDMHPISEPFVMYHKAEKDEESGVTGVIILAESSITIHTYPSRKWFSLDLYSCNEFELDKTKQFIRDRLKVTDYSTKTLRRGFYNGTSQKHQD